MSISINVLLIHSGSRVLLPGVTMALPLSGSIKELGLDENVKVGVLSSYSDLVGCLAEIVDLTILPNGMPGIVVRGTDRIRILGRRRSDGQFTFGAIERLSPVDGDLNVSQRLLDSFMETVASAGIFRRQCPKFSATHKFTATDLYAIANKLCPGLERINVLKADNVQTIFEHLKRCIPGASLFSGNFGARPVTQPVL
jgi:Lon protease-like protein